MAGILDFHVDCIIQHQLFGYRIERRHRAGFSGQPLFWHADLPRMRDAEYRGVCFGIHWFPWQSEGAWEGANRQINYLDRITEAEPDLVRVRDPADWARADEQDGIAVAPGVEGAHILNRRLERVGDLADRDVAYLTLTHFSANAAATPSMGRGANENDPLTPFGRDLVVTLEDHGITVDLAHVNTPGVLDACSIAEQPVICTHTGVRGVHDSPRNVTDEEIDAIAETGGVIGIIFAPKFLTGDLVATSAAVADHIEYVADRVGLEHVAIGSDYDGWIPSIPSDQRDCRDIDQVFDELQSRGWYRDEIDAIKRDNALEVLSGERAD